MYVNLNGSGVTVKVTSSDGTVCKIKDTRPDYTVKFYLNDETQTVWDTKIGKFWDYVQTPSSPVRENYLFLGWHANKDNDTGYTSKNLLVNTPSYYAIWQQAYLTITPLSSWAQAGGTYDSSKGTVTCKGPNCTITIPSAGYNVTVTSIDGGGGAYAYDSSGNTLWSCTGSDLSSATGEKTYTTTGKTSKITLGGMVTIKITLKDGTACKLKLK